MAAPRLRNRDFMRLWSGQVVSALGSAVSSLAFPLLVLALTHSPARAGLVGLAGTLPFLLFQLPAGGLVGRWDRKRTMIVSDALRGGAIGVEPGEFLTNEAGVLLVEVVTVERRVATTSSRKMSHSRTWPKATSSPWRASAAPTPT